MSLFPRYTLFTDKTLRQRKLDPKKFAEDVAETERKNSEWDTDGGYAKLIQESRVAAAGDENRAEDILFEILAEKAATRYVKDLEEEKEGRRRAAAEEKMRRRKTAAAAEDAEWRREEKEKRQRQRKRTPAVMTNGRIDFSLIGLYPPPRDVGEFIRQQYDGVSDVKLVIMKGLFPTDISGNHNRISIPERQIIDVDFLTAAEKDFLDSKEEGGSPPGIPVKLYGPKAGECTDMVLKKWELQKSDSYVLNKGWMSLVRKFPAILRVNAIVQLWSFRTSANELAFLIAKVAQLSENNIPANRPSLSGPGSSSGSDPSGSRSRSDDGSDDGSGRDGGDLEEGEVTPPRRGPRVWRGSYAPPEY